MNGHAGSSGSGSGMNGNIGGGMGGSGVGGFRPATPNSRYVDRYEGGEEGGWVGLRGGAKRCVDVMEEWDGIGGLIRLREKRRTDQSTD